MNEPTHRMAYDYTPDQEAPGEGIEWLKEHATTEISREDSASMNCAVFTEVIEAVNYIGDVEDINPYRLFVALCVKGRNLCYHEMKLNHGDVFTEIAEQLSRGRRAMHSPSKRAAARDNTFKIFNNTVSTKFNTDRQTTKIASDEAKKCGVRTSQLNLYWTLTGLKYIVNNEPMYILYRDESLFTEALQPLEKANTLLNGRRDMLKAWMSI